MASKIFPNQEGLDNFLKSKSLHKISEGSEAKCYLSYVDGLAYKRISKGRTGDFITKDQIDLPSFAFPKDLFIVDEKVYGYRSEYIDPNLFLIDAYNPLSIVKFKKLNLQNLKRALEIFAKDTDRLSKEHIQIYDMAFNLAFTGTRLVAFDTLDYFRTEKDVTEMNRSSIDYAIKTLFNLWLQIDPFTSLNQLPLEEYLKEIEGIQRRLIKSDENY